MEQKYRRSTVFKLIILGLLAILLLTFWITLRQASGMVSLTLLPEVPREGEPIIVIMKLTNPGVNAELTDYEFYADAQLLKKGSTLLPAHTSKTYKFVYENSTAIGEQISFSSKAHSATDTEQRYVSYPAYPPQILTSFVSFASFSTSMMGFMTTMLYYDGNFGNNAGLNAGLIISAVLIILLVFLELSQPLTGRHIARLGRLRIRFSSLTWVLFIIFVGIIYTKVLMILAN